MTEQYLNVIGKRIDAAHGMISKSEPGSWAYNYWTTVLNSLVRQLNKG